VIRGFMDKLRGDVVRRGNELLVRFALMCGRLDVHAQACFLGQYRDEMLGYWRRPVATLAAVGRRPPRHWFRSPKDPLFPNAIACLSRDVEFA